MIFQKNINTDHDGHYRRQRRKFISQSSILLSGLLFQKELLAKKKQFQEERLRIGILGCGNRGVGMIRPLQELKDKFEVTAICDILDFRLENAKAATSNTSVKVYRDYRKLLDDKSVTAVLIATPLYLHYQMTTDALRAGKHVFLEKTMTYTIEQAIALVKLSESLPNQILQIGHQLPYTPLYIRVKEMIKQGFLGKVTQVDCRFDRHADWRNPVPDPSLERTINWRMYKEYSGGLTAELLSHQMQFINWAFDTHPDEIFSTGGIDFFKDGRETYDNVQIMLRYSQLGIVGNFGSTLANEREGFIFKIKGSKGTVELLFDEGMYFPEKETKKELDTIDGVTGATKIEWKDNGGMSIYKEKMKDGSWYALDDFYKCVSEIKKPKLSVVQGATAAITVALANRALYNHTLEKWLPKYEF